MKLERKKKLFFIYARIMIFPLDRPQRMIPRCWSFARSTFLQATPTRDCIKVGSSKQCKDQDRIYMTTGKGKRGFWIRWFSRRTLKSVCCHDSFSRFRWKRKPPVPLGHEYHVQLLVEWNGISVLCVPVCCAVLHLIEGLTLDVVSAYLDWDSIPGTAGSERWHRANTES